MGKGRTNRAVGIGCVVIGVPLLIACGSVTRACAPDVVVITPTGSVVKDNSLAAALNAASTDGKSTWTRFPVAP